MRPLIAPADMRDMEKRYFDATQTPSIDLMERAAKALCDCLIRRYGPDRRVYFACGPGGNGGDGYACARLYAEAGGQCALFPAAPPATDDARENRVRAAGLPALAPDADADAPDVWVDALYGTGLSRPPEGSAAAVNIYRDEDGYFVVDVKGSDEAGYAPDELAMLGQHIQPRGVRGHPLGPERADRRGLRALREGRRHRHVPV